MRLAMNVFLFLLLLAGSAAGQEMIEAARAGDQDRLRTLLAGDPAAVSATDDRGCTPLHFAVDRGDAELVKLLLAAGADIQARDEDGDTPLHWAACTDHVTMIDLLADRGAQLDALNHSHVTPVLYATQRLKYAVVERLVQRGADLEVPDDYGRTPLIWTARERGDLEMARLLLRVGANVNALDRFQDSALELAAWRGFRTLVDMLLDAGAETGLQPGMRESLLGYAVEFGLERLYRQLVAEGVKIVLEPGESTNLLHVAAQGGSSAILKDLLEQGVPADAADLYGWTPLHRAADGKRGEAVKLLLAAGTPRDPRTRSGHSPLSLALARGALDVVESLEQAGHTGKRREFPRLTGDYLGQGEPPDEPQPFALDIVATWRGEHGSVSFTPDGGEVFWSGYYDNADSGYQEGNILTSRRVNGRWTPPRIAPFAEEFRGDVPFAAPDGKRVFFMSRRPLEPGGEEGAEHIWFVERSGDGWGEPRPLPPCVNDMPQHWQISVAASGNLYFSSRRPAPDTQGVYVSRPVDGQYAEPEFLGFAEGTPYIAPDESYLITSTGFGRDNVVRFRRADGVWSEPVSIGETYPGYAGICPQVSHDGRAFFGINRSTGANNNFWVKADFLEELRRRAGQAEEGS